MRHLLEYLGSFNCRIIPSANRDKLTSSFPVISLYFFSFFIALAKISNTALSKSGDSEQSFIITDLQEMLSSFSPFNIMLAVDLLYIVFIMSRHDSSVPSFFMSFIAKGC
jgi:hypothetical protein